MLIVTELFGASICSEMFFLRSKTYNETKDLCISIQFIGAGHVLQVQCDLGLLVSYFKYEKTTIFSLVICARLEIGRVNA